MYDFQQMSSNNFSSSRHLLNMYHRWEPGIGVNQQIPNAISIFITILSLIFSREQEFL
jgi:hypothetical protein